MSTYEDGYPGVSGEYVGADLDISPGRLRRMAIELGVVASESTTEQPKDCSGPGLDMSKLDVEVMRRNLGIQ